MTYIVDQESEVGLLGALIVTHVLLPIAVELGWFALLIWIVLLFVYQHCLLFLRQSNIRGCLSSTQISEVILRRSILLAYHLVHIGVLLALTVVMTVSWGFGSRLLDNVSGQVLHGLGAEWLIEGRQVVNHFVELLRVDVERAYRLLLLHVHPLYSIKLITRYL